MRAIRLRLATVFVAIAPLVAGCSGGTAEGPAAGAISPQVLEALQVPDNPYRIIYSPPVDLAKRPAT